jgi:hypothetical protein
MIVDRVTEAELIRLTAHLLARHPEQDRHASCRRFRDVLRHFRARAVSGVKPLPVRAAPKENA